MKAKRFVYFRKLDDSDKLVMFDSKTELPIEFEGMKDNGLYQELVETAYGYGGFNNKDDDAVDLQMEAEFSPEKDVMLAKDPVVYVNMHNPQIHMTVVYDLVTGKRTTIK